MNIIVPNCRICKRSPLTYLGTVWMLWVALVWNAPLLRSLGLAVGGQLLMFALNHALHFTFGWFRGDPPA